jgi:putative transcriptional regulator
MSCLAGSFLIARPTLTDPSFARAVVLLLQHDADGAFGLVVNRPVQQEGLPLPVCAGGPCQTPGLFMLHGHPEWAGISPTEVAPGIFVGDNSCLSHARDAQADEVQRCRVFLGYAGWGPGQLEKEIAAGAWAAAAASSALLFDTPAEELWEQLAPPRIPDPSLN